MKKSLFILFLQTLVKSLAQRGKTATGWFYGLKLHLIIDPLGELISLVFSSGNKSEVNQQLILALTQKITEGKSFGDAGYLSAKLVEILIEKGRWLMSKIRRNMKNKLMPIKDKFLLKKRAIIETVIDFLKYIFDLWHTRHRAIDNAFNNAMACLAAYQFLDKKPSISMKNKRKMVLSLVNSPN
ncbi:MAG: transposase [Bacteroidota bacterium]